MSGSPNDTHVEARLKRSLRSLADRIPVPDEPFDAERSPTIVTLPDRAARQRRSRPTVVWWAGAAAVAVAGAVVGAGALRSPVETPGGPSGTVAPTPPAGPSLIPASAPDGYHLVGITARDTMLPAVPDPNRVGLQLLETTPSTAGVRAGILLEMQPGNGGFGDGQPITVRGQAGLRSAPKDVGDFALSWNEGGAMVMATTHGLTDAAALDLLGQLTLHTPGDLLAGLFAAPPGAPFVVLDDAAHGGRITTTELSYGDDDPGDPPVNITTTTAGGFGYLRARLAGDVAADGTVQTVDRWMSAPGIASDRSDLIMAWPDGRGVRIEWHREPDLDLLGRVARSTTLVDEAGRQALLARASRASQSMETGGSTPG